MEPYYEADGRLPSLPRVDQVMTGLTAAEVATVREVRSHIVTGHKLTPLLVEDLLAIVDRLTGNVGHCAGPSWAAHEVLAVATGEPCPACGTVMPMTNTCACCNDPRPPSVTDDIYWCEDCIGEIHR